MDNAGGGEGFRLHLNRKVLKRLKLPTWSQCPTQSIANLVFPKCSDLSPGFGRVLYAMR